MTPKLVSNRFMDLWNEWKGYENPNHRRMSKRTFMAMLAILSRKQQRLITEQFNRSKS